MPKYDDLGLVLKVLKELPLGTEIERAIALGRMYGKGAEMEAAVKQWSSQKSFFRRNGSIEDVVGRVLNQRQRTSTSYDGFAIEEDNDSYILHDVPYDSGLADLAWGKEYLDGGRTHSQQEWVSISDNVPDILAYHATITSLVQNKKGTQSALVKKVSKMFLKDFQNNWMTTSTRIIYTPSGKDEIVHNYGSGRETRVKVDFVGTDSLVTTAGSGHEEQMEALLGTGNLKEIEENYYTFSGRWPYLYLWRLNKKPQRTTERAVVLGISDGGGFGIDARDGIYGRILARGVRVESAEGAR